VTFDTTPFFSLSELFSNSHKWVTCSVPWTVPHSLTSLCPANEGVETWRPTCTALRRLVEQEWSGIARWRYQQVTPAALVSFPQAKMRWEAVLHIVWKSLFVGSLLSCAFVGSKISWKERNFHGAIMTGVLVIHLIRTFSKAVLHLMEPCSPCFRFFSIHVSGFWPILGWMCRGQIVGDKVWREYFWRARFDSSNDREKALYEGWILQPSVLDLACHYVHTVHTVHTSRGPPSGTSEMFWVFFWWTINSN
jgi:hypothetical protein